MTSHQGHTANDGARQHNGNVYGNMTNNTNNTFHAPSRTLDDAQRDGQALLKASGDGKTERVAMLIANGANRNYTDDRGFSALHHACYGGQEETACSLIDDHGLDVDAVSKNYGTPLCVAAVKGHRQVVAMLIEKGASVRARGGHLGSALHAACHAGDVEMVEMLLMGGISLELTCTIQWSTGAPLQVVDLNNMQPTDYGTLSAIRIDQCRPVHIAAMNEHSDVLQLLLFNGAEPDAIARGTYSSEESGKSDSFACTALSFAETVACLSALLDAGADIDHRDHSDATAMMCAAAGGNLPALKLLIERGAFIDARMKYSDTALHPTAMRGKTASIRYLLAKGADVTARNEHGFVPVMSAILTGRRQCVAIFTEFWRLQINAGTSSSHFRDDFTRERHIPFDANETMSMLQDLRVNLDAPFQLVGKRYTPLWFAIERQIEEAVELLLDLGASMKNDLGQKARDFALSCNRATRTQDWNSIIAVLDRYSSGMGVGVAATDRRGAAPQIQGEDVLLMMLARGLKKVLR
ncbi:uncharacterized protein RCC_01595 [Ramularia collo-cygni]|uniref:Uncharacterized protein n=1 Tax=Ramularia collo-cygni TaxID=112498 RepID=A0A2D3UMV3_9PEZI|nr:uncharacterized protein RCC_01595 [Ramularia collo-cygni]CZT15761.1 uncharacterized protein RCC_01595 [Ramularia collo-cygni]